MQPPQIYILEINLNLICVFLNWQCEAEYASMALAPRFSPNASAMSFNQRASNRQTDPASAACLAGAGFIYSIEPIEDA